MKSVFDISTREELANRISSLQEKTAAQWGKMNAYQMVRHCLMCEEMFFGRLKLKRVFIGRLIGPVLLKSALKEGRPFDKNAPTDPILKITEQSGDLEKEKQAWINTIGQYPNFDNNDFAHPFFGRMSKEQVGMFSYKHADHHLRQFGV